MKPGSHLLKSLTLLALLTPTFLLAEDREAIGIRQPTEIITQEEPEEAVCTELNEAECGLVFDRFPQASFPMNAHILAAVSTLGETVEIEDGSVWKVSPYDGYKAQYWRTTDPVVITQNNRWFSSYSYRIVNKNTNASIETNLFLGPITNGAYSRYINSIDTTRGVTTLNDQTHWEVSSRDLAIFRDWATNDSIIVGYNSSWDSSCEGLLINVTMNNSVRARQF